MYKQQERRKLIIPYIQFLLVFYIFQRGREGGMKSTEILFSHVPVKWLEFIYCGEVEGKCEAWFIPNLPHYFFQEVRRDTSPFKLSSTLCCWCQGKIHILSSRATTVCSRGYQPVRWTRKDAPSINNMDKKRIFHHDTGVEGVRKQIILSYDQRICFVAKFWSFSNFFIHTCVTHSQWPLGMPKTVDPLRSAEV